VPSQKWVQNVCHDAKTLCGFFFFECTPLKTLFLGPKHLKNGTFWAFAIFDPSDEIFSSRFVF
jgi:hypothetical protein